MTIVPEHLEGARLTIDLGALVANWRQLAEMVAPATCSAIVKANAYGLGLEEVAGALWEAGARVYFVAVPEEAVRLRAALPRATIYVLGGLFPDCLDAYTEFDFVPVIGSEPELRNWERHAETFSRPLPLALHFDTGMNRLGFAVEKARDIADRLRGGRLDPLLVMTHIACGDTPGHPLNQLQKTRFETVRQSFPLVPASFANSAGVFMGPDAHYDLVRPGIAVYGGRFGPRAGDHLRPVVTLEARILQIRDVNAGEGVGYGARQTTTRPSRIAILALGYADGFHRIASGSDGKPGASGFLHGRTAPFFGRISMDLAAVDVTDIPQAQPGDEVELIGPNRPLAQAADAMQTIDYEVLTSLGLRYHRTYISA